jgi:HTH-type transcriptional regulator / antitoxin HipB
MSPTLVQSPSALGRALRDARRARGLSQGEVAELAGITQATVSHAERGTRPLSIDTVLRLLSALKLELVIQNRGSEEPDARWRRSR